MTRRNFFKLAFSALAVVVANPLSLFKSAEAKAVPPRWVERRSIGWTDWNGVGLPPPQAGPPPFGYESASYSGDFRFVKGEVILVNGVPHKIGRTWIGK